MSLNFYRWETEIAFNQLQDYMKTMEEQVRMVQDRELSKILEKRRSLSEAQRAEWQFDEEIFEERYERDFPSKTRYSFLVLLYIVIVTRLSGLCDVIAEEKNGELREKDLKGAEIERARVYLEKVANVRVKKDGDWEWLMDFQKVRNCIVHANGYIEASRDKRRLRALCKKGYGLSVQEGETLVIEERYCTKTLQVAQNWFDQLFDAAGFGPSIRQAFSL